MHIITAEDTEDTAERNRDKKGGLQLKEGQAVVQRRTLSSENDKVGHPCSHERATKTPELSVSISEGDMVVSRMSRRNQKKGL